MVKDANAAEKGQAKEGLDCPDGGSCRFANPALEEIARQRQETQ
jgi:hypothetical protein